MIRRLPARALSNTAGEMEPEVFSRQRNLIEPFLVMVLLLAGAWWLAYPLGVLNGVEAANAITRMLLAAMLVFTLVISPWLHRDSAASRGLGTPRRAWAALNALPASRRIIVASFLGGFILLLTGLTYDKAGDLLRFLIGVPREAVLRFGTTFGGSVVLLSGSFAVAVFFTLCALRLDNLGSALRTAGGILLVLLPVVLLLALVANGPAAFATFDPGRLLSRAFGYAFWGAFQQLIFCSYFGTRLRKGIGPAKDPHAQRRQRLGVAALTGLFFGLIHISSWYLVMLTWLFGTFLAWAFMEDRCRNLLVLGAVHGILGTCASWLFRAGNDLHINMRVGPWAMPRAVDVLTILVTTLLIGCFCYIILRVTRTPQPD